MNPWEGWSCDRDSRFTCAGTTTTSPNATPPGWYPECHRDSRTCLISTTAPITGPTLTPITVVEYPHLVYDVETEASDYVILGRKKFRIRCKCPRSDPDRACNWYQSHITVTEEFLKSLRCEPPTDSNPATTNPPAMPATTKAPVSSVTI